MKGLWLFNMPRIPWKVGKPEDQMRRALIDVLRSVGAIDTEANLPHAALLKKAKEFVIMMHGVMMKRGLVDSIPAIDDDIPF